jgi:hypothetical protein
MYIYLLKIENFGVAIATLSLYVDLPLSRRNYDIYKMYTN